MNFHPTGVLIPVEFKHFHVCGGSGSGARGFQEASARLGNMIVTPRCLGSVDVDLAGCEDFQMMTGAKQTRLDLFDERQYRDFHGKAPPTGWIEATPDDIWRAQGCETPDIVFASFPCKGFSGLLSEAQSKSAKYQALNSMTERGMFLLLEANRNHPIKIILFENVPRIATRGRKFLDRIQRQLSAYNYVWEETEHDCGEIAPGGLGQSRKRFLMVARHAPQVPNFLYEPVKYSLRSVGSVLDKLPVPLSGLGGPLHRMPRLHWKTWVRLALVEAGSDWRALNKLVVEDGFLRDYGIVPDREWHGGGLGVHAWQDTAGTIKSRSLPTNGANSVADPRPPHRSDGYKSVKYRVTRREEPAGTVIAASTTGQGAFAIADPHVDGHPKSVQLGVRKMSQTAATVTGKMIAGGGPNSIADPRLSGTVFNHVFRIVRFDETAPALKGPGGPAGGLSVADTRYDWHPGASSSKLRITPWKGEPARSVTGSQQVASGAGAIQDPRPQALSSAERNVYLTGGHYGVVPWDQSSRAIPGHAKNNNGPWSVADPRVPEDLPAANDKVVCIIRAIDGTWHRPFTTLECAALQSMFDPERYFTSPEDYWDLHGMSDSAKRERIGNAVPSDSAKGMATAIYTCLLNARNGETFTLSSQPIWVQPVALALAAARQL